MMDTWCQMLDLQPETRQNDSAILLNILPIIMLVHFFVGSWPGQTRGTLDGKNPEADR